ANGNTIGIIFSAVAWTKSLQIGDAVQEKQLAEWFDDQAVTGCLVQDVRFRQVELESDNALLIEILQMSLASMTSSDFEHFLVLEELSHEINTFLDKNTRSSILEES
ncbi:hypothetical protein Golax_019956, partial [Gossypium laxum]|nr:hypothetical protein [Gossypium laxum]